MLFCGYSFFYIFKQFCNTCIGQNILMLFFKRTSQKNWWSMSGVFKTYNFVAINTFSYINTTNVTTNITKLQKKKETFQQLSSKTNNICILCTLFVQFMHISTICTKSVTNCTFLLQYIKQLNGFDWILLVIKCLKMLKNVQECTNMMYMCMFFVRIYKVFTFLYTCVHLYTCFYILYNFHACITQLI